VGENPREAKSLWKEIEGGYEEEWLKKLSIKKKNYPRCKEKGELGKGLVLQDNQWEARNPCLGKRD